MVRRARALAVLFVVLVACAAAAIVVTRSGDADLTAPEGTASGVEPSTTSSSTTATSTSTTTTSTTTTIPPTPTSVPGVSVGPLIGGPGPIPVLRRIPTTDRVVFITIDDGAFADPDALAVIRDQAIPVTMFLNQAMFRSNGQYFRDLQSVGAVVGSHTSNHANLRGRDAAFQHAEICDMNAQAAELFGHAPTLFRPPYGNYDQTTLQQAASCGIVAAFHWSATADTGEIITAEGPLQAGDIILMHFKPDLGMKLRFVLAQIQAAGLRPARLQDYVASAPATAPDAAPTAAPAPAAPAAPAPTP